MDYSDLIQEIVDTGHKWQQAEGRLGSLGLSHDVWYTTAYKVGHQEVLRLAQIGRQTFKDIVQRWLMEQGMEAKIRSEAKFHLPGVDYTGPWPHETLPLGMKLRTTSIHNAKHTVQKKYRWINKITVAGDNIISQCARTDEMFTWATAEAFADFTVEVQAALNEAFRGST